MKRLREILRHPLIPFWTSLWIAQAVAPGYGQSFDSLAGPLPALLKNRSTPYIVISDIEVPAGKTVTIEPGTVLLFRTFTGLHVQGRLIARGTREKPVIFTSEFDRNHNRSSEKIANPFDWNGIYIHKDGIGTNLEYCKIYYSVYGLQSDTKFIRIAPGMFKFNGKSNVVIENTEHTVTDEPYTYALSVKDATVDGVPVRILEDPLAPRRTIVRYGGLVTILGGLGLGTWSFLQWRDAQDRLDKLSSTQLNNLTVHDASAWKAAKEERDQSRMQTYAGAAAGVLGGIGFGWTFTF